MQESSSIDQNKVWSSEQKIADARKAGIFFSLAGILFLILNTASESLYPNFSILNNAMSDMAAVGTQTFPIEESAILAVAIFWIAGAYFLFRNSKKRGLMIVNILPGVGFLLAGISPENVSIAVHSAGALLAFPFGAAAAILSFRMIRSDFKYFSVGLGALSISATLVVFLGQRIVGPCGTCAGNSQGYIQSLDQLGLGLGGWESMIIYPLLIWLIGYGSYLMAGRKLR